MEIRSHTVSQLAGDDRIVPRRPLCLVCAWRASHCYPCSAGSACNRILGGETTMQWRLLPQDRVQSRSTRRLDAGIFRASDSHSIIAGTVQYGPVARGWRCAAR